MIGVFDSGIGGVTILKELEKDYPNLDYYYYSDSSHNPYGEKTEEEIKIITKNIVEFLIQKGCKIIIIACNTASTIAVDYLRNQFPNTSFIATVPAIKVAYDKYPDTKTLVMATNGTFHSELWKSLYHSYHNPDTEILFCNGLAHLIEEENYDKIREYLKQYLTPYQGYETIVLGCTHFPIIKDEITNVLGHVHFCESKEGISKRLGILLQRFHIKQKNHKGNIIFYDSSHAKQKEERFSNLLNK